MSQDDLFNSPDAFRQCFESGLGRLLDSGELNLFILVAANASFEERLYSVLKSRLQAVYGQLHTRLRAVFAQGGRATESDDDLLVFLKIASFGFEGLALTEQRQAGCWEVQFNHLRSFRPLRNSQRPMTSIRAAFDPQAFNFNKPFIQQEALWSGERCGRHFDLYYNKYPFVEMHSLLVPEREACHPQYHQQDMHYFIWQLLETLASCLPGVRVGYNALGAFASVNHLHYQLFVREQALPVEAEHWSHNVGRDSYPVDCVRLDSASEAWTFIEELHAQNRAYNLLYTPGGMYCMPRKLQGEFPMAEWSNGFSWYELCGGMITTNYQDYAALTDSQIHAALSQTRWAPTLSA